jgi:two-component system nitrate/nitrite response regulator NarL
MVLKGMARRLLVQCIREVHSGGTWLEKNSVDPAMDTLFPRESAALKVARLLTPREIEIVREVTAGFRNGNIAQKLCISEGTVKTHLHNVYEKLRLSGRLELALYARDKGLN